MSLITVPKKIYVAAVASEGATPLNAFDACLVKIGLPQISLIKVTSVLPPNIEVLEEPPDLPKGCNVPSIYSYIVSPNKNQRIAGAIALGFSDQLTLVVEYTDFDIDAETAEQRAVNMVKEMARIRNINLNRIIAKSASHVVKNVGCVLVIAAEVE